MSEIVLGPGAKPGGKGWPLKPQSLKELREELELPEPPVDEGEAGGEVEDDFEEEPEDEFMGKDG